MPTTPTFTVVNNDDGTASVIVAGSSGGSTNTIKTAAVDNQWGDAIGWVSRGSRTGNGAVTVTTGKGVFFFIVDSSLSGSVAQSTPKPLVITDGSQPVISALLDAVQARIRLLNLVPSDRVIAQTVADEQFVADLKGGACIIVAPADDALKIFEDAQNVLQRDDVGYPIVAVYAAAANKDQKKPARDAFFRPGQAIRRAFIAQSLQSVSNSVWYCNAMPLKAAEKAWWDKMAFVHGQVLMFRSREDRGLGA